MSGQKDRERFDRFYQESHKLVRNVIYNMVGEEPLEDLTQEALLKIWNALPRFGFRSSIKTWAYRIAVNVAIDYLRTRRPAAMPLKDELAGQQDPPDLDAASKARIVHEGLMLLDDSHRATVVLFYFEGLEVTEIQNVLGIPAGTVKSRLHFARQALKEFFARKGVEV